MATLEDAERIAIHLPEVTEASRWGNRTWMVGGKGFAWERPLSKADVKRFGSETPPAGPLLAVRVADLEEKEIVLHGRGEAFFTIAHFSGYPAVLIQLSKVQPRALKEAIVDAWLACAPPALAQEYLGAHEH
ncbi:MAG TPA: MmcQ/YjbR family DNA-binding protein [Candidatus Dormibacteraeota bacterium]